MQSVCIGIGEYPDELIDFMTSELIKINNSDFEFIVEESNLLNPYSVVCRICADKVLNLNSFQLYSELIIHTSNVLSDFIIKNYEESLISRIINTNYCYFNCAEKKEIFHLVMQSINNNDQLFINCLFRIRRKNIIIRKLLDYLESCNDLILEGFVNFRLKEYIKELEEVVDKAVDKFLMNREYKEFIRLLKYFVDIQDSKCNTINIFVDYNNNYLLLDEFEKEITNEYINEFVNDMDGEEINSDDLLVSSLITLAPKKVVIHSIDQFTNKELIETIKNVFIDKVVICDKCEICMSSVIKN